MRDPLATARPVLDPGRLSELLGRPARATRLRLKPGFSTLAAVAYADGDAGWIRVATERHRAKIVKAVERARRFCATVEVGEAEGLLVAHGGLASEPGLAKAVASVPQDCSLDDVLRHNPGRRLVARTEVGGNATVLRLHAAKGEASQLADRAALVASRGVRTPTAARRSRYVSLWPWVGETDLLRLESDREHPATLAGAQLARLHSLDLPGPTLDLAGELTALARDLAVLDPELGARAATAVEALDLRAGDDVTIHGDWSADQVAVGDDVWLLDLDRLGRGPAGFDLGSFHAVELLAGREPVTEAMLAGHGGSSDWQRWVAPALALRLMEPLRAARPDWREAIAARLTMVEDWSR